jgi:kynureninase
VTAPLDLKSHFSRFLGAAPDRLHFAAHSHHLWPDVTREAQLRVWDDAARLVDDKWEHVLGPVLDGLRARITRQLALPDPATLVFAPNTHEFIKRLLSCFPADLPIRVLSSDGEFHTFERQMARLAEEGLVALERIPVEPFDTFPARFAEAAQTPRDLVFVSQVFFNSGYALTDLVALTDSAGEAMLVIDGYHGFLARPTDLSAVADRAFYLAGGYKYAMAGEGACFMHCPPGWGQRPRDTGWYAAFGALAGPRPGTVGYAADGWRFMGATFDPSGLYRLDATLGWLEERELDAAAVHSHAMALARHFLAQLPVAGFSREQLVADPDVVETGNFLTFRRADAASVNSLMHQAGIVADVRGDRLRIGFGLYQTADDVDRLAHRLKGLATG